MGRILLPKRCLRNALRPYHSQLYLRFQIKLMQIGKDNIHLTYCTNIHPGEDWREVFANLKQYIPVLKSRLSPDKPFGIGLRLANIAASELLKGEKNQIQKHRR